MTFNDMVKKQRSKNNSLVKIDEDAWEKAQNEAMRWALDGTIEHLQNMLDDLEEHDETQRRFLDEEHHKYGNENDGSYLGLYMLGGGTPLDDVYEAIERAIGEIKALRDDPSTYL